MAPRIRNILSAWAALLLLAGCNGTTNPWKVLPPPATPLADAEAIWQNLTERRSAWQNLRGLASASFYTPLQNGTLDDTVVILQHFDAIRLEGIGPIGQPLFLFVADKQALSLYAPQEARLTVGTASAENFERLFGLTVSPHALQYVLFGDVPLPLLPTSGEFTYRARDNLYLWQGYVPEHTFYYRVWFEPYDVHPVRFTVEEPRGNVLWQVQYEEFQRFDKFLMPRQIVITQPSLSRRVIWHYNDIQLNSTIPPGLFHIRVPPKTERVDLDQSSPPGTLPLLRVW